MEEAEEVEVEEVEGVEGVDQLNPHQPNQQPPIRETESWKEKNPQCYDLFPFLLIYFLFCLSLCAAPCLVLFAFLCACLIAYLCVVLGHILHDT